MYNITGQVHVLLVVVEKQAIKDDPNTKPLNLVTKRSIVLYINVFYDFKLHGTLLGC